MLKKKLLVGVCLVAAAIMFPVSQATAGETNWNISGWINEGITYYDDGLDTGAAQLSDNGTTLGSRITLSGSHKIDNTNLTAGFEVITEVMSGTPNWAGFGHVTPLAFSNQDNVDTFNGGDIGLLGSSLYIGGGWGKITIGLQSMPTDNIAVLADPSGTIWSGISVLFRANGFFIRGLDPSVSGATWGQFAQCLTTPGLGIGIDCNGIYRNGVRYDLPAFGPVSVAVGWANDQIYDIAAKYSGKLGPLTANLHMGYTKNNDGGSNVGGKDTDAFQVEGGLMDPGTGLFGVVAYQTEEADKADPDTGDDTDAWYLKAGIKRRFFGLGDTYFFGEFANYNDQYGSTAGITDSELERIGFVVGQEFGGRLRAYLKWEVYSLDVDGPSKALYSGADDLDLMTLGFTYFF